MLVEHSTARVHSPGTGSGNGDPFANVLTFDPPEFPSLGPSSSIAERTRRGPVPIRVVYHRCIEWIPHNTALQHARCRVVNLHVCRHRYLCSYRQRYWYQSWWWLQSCAILTMAHTMVQVCRHHTMMSIERMGSLQGSSAPLHRHEDGTCTHCCLPACATSAYHGVVFSCVVSMSDVCVIRYVYVLPTNGPPEKAIVELVRMQHFTDNHAQSGIRFPFLYVVLVSSNLW